MRVKFEERREYNASGGYLFTNESIELTTELVKKASPKRIAGICSSGDLLFGSFAPHAEACVAVDHALESIKTALTKAVLIEHLTGVELKRLLNDAASHYDSYARSGVGPPACQLQDAVREAQKELPDLVARQRGYYGDPLEIPAPKWGVTWKCVTEKDIDAARERLDNITVIHGDLADLDGFDKFDMLYMSNAMEHTGYNGSGPDLNKIAEQFLVPDAHVLFTCSALTKRFESGWSMKFGDANPRVNFKHPEEMTSWKYHLLQKKVPAAS